VSAVQQVMRAVWALARAQQPRAEAAASEASVYLEWAESIVERLAGPHAPVERPDTLWVLVGPERAFCGPLARVLLQQLPAEGAIGLVGSRLVDVARHDTDLGERILFELPAASTVDEMPRLAERIAQAVLDAQDDARAVVVLHPVDGTSSVQGAVLLSGERATAPEVPESWLPVDEVLEATVLEAVEGRLVVALAEAMRSEVRARLAASDAARRACERQLDELTQHGRTLRQSTITQELLELTAARTSRRD
jgi:F0F1-type ATP synthase gamma subunit